MSANTRLLSAAGGGISIPVTLHSSVGCIRKLSSFLPAILVVVSRGRIKTFPEERSNGSTTNYSIVHKLDSFSRKSA